VAEGRRYSFDDAKARRARELEDELSVQRQVIKGEGRQQVADIQRVATEARNGLDHAVAERTNGIHWGAAEEWEQLDKTVSERSAELERTGEEIERASIDAREKFKKAAVAEAQRID